jgi:hypothetical protein
MWTKTSMEAEHSWAITWLTFGIILVLAMGYIMM